MATAEEKPVMVVGLDDSQHSFYALEWILDHFFGPSPNSHTAPFKLLIVHAKPTATSAIGLAGPGGADVLPYVEADLRKISSRVAEKAKQICSAKSVEMQKKPAYRRPLWFRYSPDIAHRGSSMHRVNDVVVEVMEGDARNVLCDAVEKHHASMLVVGSHGYGVLKRTVLGSVSDYCAHHAHCSVMIVKRPKVKA